MLSVYCYYSNGKSVIDQWNYYLESQENVIVSDSYVNSIRINSKGNSGVQLISCWVWRIMRCICGYNDIPIWSHAINMENMLTQGKRKIWSRHLIGYYIQISLKYTIIWEKRTNVWILCINYSQGRKRIRINKVNWISIFV